MTPCPELGALEHTPLAPPISEHVATCPACQLVVDVFAGGGDDCVAFDALLAARADGTLNTAGKNLLDRHLASCATCREVAETLSPIADRGGDHAALPHVDPSAYELGLEVGRGGMGRVLAARDLRVGRPVAVKELLGRAPQLAARFEREARVTARLQHPGIVPIYEIGRWPDGTPFYTMRMVEGRSLLDVIETAPTLAARLALLPAVIAASEAVAFAHAQRVIHRDLTPSNVLVGAYGETVVIDWGLAKDLSEAVPEPETPDTGDDEPERADKLTGAGAVIGTAAYMPPEQAHAIPVDERADVYALGAILYHLLAGVAPFRAKSTRELLRDVRTGPPVPVGELAPGAPRDLVSIVEKAMARDPDQRYPSARELTEELKRFQTGRMVEAHAYSGADRVLRFVRRHKAAVAITAAATVLLAVMGAISVSRVLRSRAELRDTVGELLVEEGRAELGAGNPLRALAYLQEAWMRAPHSAVLGFLINTALDVLPDSERLLDCGGDVRFLDVTPDGTRVMAACHDVARLWTLATGEQIATFPRQAGAYDGLRFSHDGRLVVTFGGTGEARVWNAQTGVRGATLAHGAGITAASFTPDDKRIATTGLDGTAQLWDAETGALVWKVTANTSVLRTVFGAYGELGADGTRLFTVTMDGEAKGWDVATGALVGGFQASTGALVIGAELSRDGGRAVTCGTDRLTRVWDTRTGTQLLALGGHTDVVWKCVFSTDGTRLLTTSHDGSAIVWDLATGATITSVNHGDIVLWARFSPDGRRFLTVGVDGLIRVWDARSGAPLTTHDSSGGRDAHFSPDGRLLVAQRGDGRIQIWSDTERTLASYAPAAGGTVSQVSADGMRAAVEGTGGWITLVDTVTGHALPHLEIHAPIAMSEHQLAATTDRAVVILDLATGATQRVIPLGSPPGALELSPNGARLLVTRPGAPVELWDVAAAQRLATIDGAAHAKLGRTGARVLAWADQESPFVWELGRGRLVTLPIAAPFRPLGFAADDRRVAVLEQGPGVARTLALWDAELGTRELATADVSVEPTFDATGTWLTTIGNDRNVTVWSTDDGSIHTKFVLDQLVQVQINAAGTLLAGIGDNGTSLVVLSSDGRVIAHAPIEHDAPVVGPDGFEPAAARAWWSPAQDAIVTRARSLVVWRARTRVDELDLAMRIARIVPRRIVRGRMTSIEQVPLRGRVVRADGRPVAHVVVEVERRTPARHGASPINYDTMAMQTETLTVETTGGGRFELPSVAPGPYKVTVRGTTASVEAVVGVGTDDVTLTTP